LNLKWNFKKILVNFLGKTFLPGFTHHETVIPRNDTSPRSKYCGFYATEL